jgi:hypothetical protein
VKHYMRLYIPESWKCSPISFPQNLRFFFLVLTLNSSQFLNRQFRARICKLLWCPGIDSEESILQPMFLAGRYDRKGSRTGPPGWESIPGLNKRFTNAGSSLSQFLNRQFRARICKLLWCSGIDSEEPILQPMYLAGRYDRKGSRTGPPGWKSIPGLIKRFTNAGSSLDPGTEQRIRHYYCRIGTEEGVICMVHMENGSAALALLNKVCNCIYYRKPWKKFRYVTLLYWVILLAR